MPMTATCSRENASLVECRCNTLEARHASRLQLLHDGGEVGRPFFGARLPDFYAGTANRWGQTIGGPSFRVRHGNGVRGVRNMRLPTSRLGLAGNWCFDSRDALEKSGRPHLTLPARRLHVKGPRRVGNPRRAAASPPRPHRQLPSREGVNQSCRAPADLELKPMSTRWSPHELQ
jgi:hypothetical protein